MKLEPHPVLAGVIAALALLSVYLLLVVLATPTILPDLAISLAISRNWPYMVVMATAIGVQAYLSVYSRRLPCKLQKTSAVGASSSAVASFTSFFGLTSVGCCGLLPFWISLALGGGAIGTGASTFLVEYSTPLTVLGISVMAASIFVSIRRIRKSIGGSAPRKATNVSGVGPG